ncbi:hypothetical protein NQ314_010630 [Rhamnusium bicolor]|uniref:Uncharacterized protein n=1 Tax=Rhamnusium bicolor TaxID=1586634 RepID=A0AAV8XQ73_9CUCU|nr:hypothetical protein NQ314_010630 [Rhamnusium bicolor]
MTSPSIVSPSDTKLLLSNKVILIPEQIKPYPKAQPRVKKINSRQGKSRIYTSTPEKQRIEEILKAKEEKLAKLKKNVEPVKKKLKLVESSSEEDSISELSLSDSVGDISEEEFPLLCDDEELNLKDFVLVQFCTKKTKLHYIGCIQRIINRDELEINFLRRKGNKENAFIFPVIQNVSEVSRSDVIMKLPNPIPVGTTSRQSGCISLSVNFSSLNITIM